MTVRKLLKFPQIFSLPEESFDGILFDHYPISNKEEFDDSYAFIKAGYKLLKKGGVLTYYSNEIDYFQPNHLEKIKEAGFTEIEYKLVSYFAMKHYDNKSLKRSMLIHLKTVNIGMPKQFCLLV